MPDPQNPWQVVSEAPAPQQSAPAGGGQDPWKVVSEAPAPASGNGQSDDQSVLNNDPVTGAKIADLGTGVVKSAGQTVNAVSKLFKGGQEFLDRHPVLRAGAAAATLGGSEVAHAVGSAIPQQGINAADKMEELQGPDQKIGGGLEAAAEFMLGDEALKGLSLADKIPLIGKAMKSLEEAPSLLKNVLAHMAKTGARNATVGGVQALAHGATLGEALETAAATGGVGAGAEAIGGGVSTLLGKVKGGGLAKSSANLEKAAAVDLTTKAKPIKEVGKDVQASADSVRTKAGKAVGSAKDAVKATLPEGQLDFPKDGNASTTAKQVLEDIGGTKLGLKDPDMAEIKDLAQTLADGKTAEGKPLTYSPEEADAERRSLNAKIETLKGKADQGGNATALRHLTRLKQGFDADYFDMLEKHGDPAAVQNLRTLNKQYADIVTNQTDSPAAKLLNKQSPEQVVTSIIAGGKNSQTAVEELVKNLDDGGKKALADSVLKEMHSKATLPGGPNKGTVNMQGVQAALEKMGDTAKAVFGKDLPAIKQYTDAAADYQAVLEAKAAKPSIVQKGVKAGARMVGAGGGAMVAGPLGAIGGELAAGEIADSLFQQGRSGAVKIGISPTEKIVLSPVEVAAKRPTITKFLKAKSAGNTAAMAAAYNALAGKKNEDSGDKPRGDL